MSPTPRSETLAEPLSLHATTIAYAGRAAMLRGPSGSGKSSLALQLIALGALLVADDRTRLTRQGGQVLAHAPLTHANRIEARQVGILNVPGSPSAKLELIVDMAEEETERLPLPRFDSLLGLPFPIIRKSNAPHFPASVALYLQHGRFDQDSQAHG